MYGRGRHTRRTQLEIVDAIWTPVCYPLLMGDIVKKLKNGQASWYIRYKDVDGVRRHRASHQPTKEAARRYLLEVEGRIARGLVGIPEPTPSAPTVSALCQRFLTEYSRPKIKDLARYRAAASTGLNRLLPLLGKIRADLVQSTDVIKARDTLLMHKSAASVKLSLAFFAAVYAWGMKQGIVTANPVKGVERPIAYPSVDYFNVDEVTSILKTPCDDLRLRACLRLALHAGLRKGELLGLRWQDLDYTTQRLTVARSYKLKPKSGYARHLRLPAACIPSLKAWKPVCPQTSDGLVFPVNRAGDTPDRALLGLPRLLRNAGVRIPIHPWHTLRHTFASHFIMQGGNILTLQKILGHSDIKMTLVYSHLSPDFLGTEMDRVQYREEAKPMQAYY